VALTAPDAYAAGWPSWSHGYTGDVYYSDGAQEVTLTMPAATYGVYFYIQPADPTEHEFRATLECGCFVEFVADGSVGAVFFGLCSYQEILTIQLDCLSESDFAIGEFGICCLPRQGACCNPCDGTCTDDAWSDECAAQGFPFYLDGTCADLDPPCGNPGACCDDFAAICEDDVYAINCTGTRFLPGGVCDDFAPVCGVFATGDVNCDGAVTMADITPFIVALTAPDAYAAGWPDCDIMIADINGDGAVNPLDIDPFIQLLTEE